MSLNSIALHKLLKDYEWKIYRSKQSIKEGVDLNHIDKFEQIVVVKGNGKWIGIPADAGTTEKDILEEVKKHGKQIG